MSQLRHLAAAAGLAWAVATPAASFAQAPTFGYQWAWNVQASTGDALDNYADPAWSQATTLSATKYRSDTDGKAKVKASLTPDTHAMTLVTDTTTGYATNTTAGGTASAGTDLFWFDTFHLGGTSAVTATVTVIYTATAAMDTTGIATNANPSASASLFSTLTGKVCPASAGTPLTALPYVPGTCDLHDHELQFTLGAQGTLHAKRKYQVAGGTTFMLGLLANPLNGGEGGKSTVNLKDVHMKVLVDQGLSFWTDSGLPYDSY